MNLLESTRRKLLNGGFLNADELTQEQYCLVTNPEASAQDIFRLHDELFGGNLRNIPNYALATGPYIELLEPELPEEEEPAAESVETIEPAPLTAAQT